MVLLILCIVIALGVSFLCSLTEACLLSVSLAEVAELASKKPRAAAELRKLKENVQQPIAAILIINNLVNIIGAALAGAIFSDLFGNRWLGVFSFLFALAIIQWSEFLPKTLGVIYKRPLAGLITLPLAYITRALRPLVFVLERFSRPFLGRGKHKMAVDPLNEIMVLTHFASINKLISPEQTNLVARSIRLSQSQVQDIMVGRDEIKFLSTTMNLAEALVAAHIHHHTRYILVQDGNLDEVVGYVNVKDIVSALQINPKDPSLKGIARPLLSVRSALLVPDLLKELTRGYQHMAVVRNDHGRTVGLVTLEDVVESIVGEIEDEYDVLPTYVYPISEVRFLAGGGVSLSTLRQKTGLALPDQPDNLHDWLCALHNGLPPIEHAMQFGDVLFIVRKIRRSRIHEVVVERRPPTQPPAMKG
ncbi:MAG: HlyC/CorC family transporter [Lentisphaerae bacterium]|nr:HlyC/CorC family transporter [Lentisphaerota bacterium]